MQPPKVQPQPGGTLRVTLDEDQRCEVALALRTAAERFIQDAKETARGVNPNDEHDPLRRIVRQFQEQAKDARALADRLDPDGESAFVEGV